MNMAIPRLSARILALAVLLGVVCFLAPSSAHAYTKQQIDTAYKEVAICFNLAGATLHSCIDNCGFFFFRSCVAACNTAYQNSEVNCWANSILSDPDGAFFDTATIEHHGRTIRAGGPLLCPEKAKADIDVTFTQIGGAIAKGHVTVECPAEATDFSVQLHTSGPGKFLPFGDVRACASAQVSAHGHSLQAFQWCRDVLLVPKGAELGD